MNDYWHIPRASLATSSAASSASSSNRSHKSNSNPPTVNKRTAGQSGNSGNGSGNGIRGGIAMTNGRAIAAVHGSGNSGGRNGGVSSKHTHSQFNSSNQNAPRRNSELSATSAAATAAAAAAVLAAAAAAAAPKRGSRSSQGSSDSNNSTRSAASGSLLLTAANLERFAEIHRRQDQQHKLYLQSSLPNTIQHNNDRSLMAAKHNTETDATINTVYNANLIHSLTPQHITHNNQHNHNSNTNNSSSNDDVIITMDPNLNFIKTKDLDSVSLASSMHFTMVNGDGPAKRPKRGLCDRGRQVTVLIVSMSTIFLLLIMGMVYALEMRARDMPQS